MKAWWVARSLRCSAKRVQGGRRCRRALIRCLLALTAALSMSGRAAWASRSVAASPVLRTITLGLAPRAPAEDETLGHVLVYNAGQATAETVAIGTGTILASVPLGSADDYDFTDVDPRSHHFFLSLPRYYASKRGGNKVYMLDSRTGALVRALPGVEIPGELVVDAAHFHLFVADTHRNAVLMYDTRDGVLLRALPSCHAPRELALSTSTDHLFVHCTDGTLVMYDAITGTIQHEIAGHQIVRVTAAVKAVGFDTGMSVIEDTHRLVLSDLFTGNTTLYDDRTGDPIGGVLRHAAFWKFQGDATGEVAVIRVDGKIVVFSSATGAVLRVLPPPMGGRGYAWGWYAMNPLTGHMLLATGPASRPGTLFVLDSRNGHVLHAITVGVSPSDWLFDVHAGVALVVNFGTGSQPGTLSVLDLQQL